MAIRVKSIGSNVSEVNTNSCTVLFSYETPVAAWILEYNPRTDMLDREAHYFKTDTFWSATTSRHINKWLSSKGLDPKKVATKPQSFFDALLNGG